MTTSKQSVIVGDTDARCKALHESGHRCLLYWDHDGDHCTINPPESGWVYWPNDDAEKRKLVDAKILEAIEGKTSVPPTPSTRGEHDGGSSSQRGSCCVWLCNKCHPDAREVLTIGFFSAKCNACGVEFGPETGGYYWLRSVIADTRAGSEGENAELRRERDGLRLQHSTALNAARLHVKRLAEAAVTCRDMSESDEERADFEMLRLDREGILSVIYELMRNPHALDEPEPTEAEVNGGPADIEF